MSTESERELREFYAVAKQANMSTALQSTIADLFKVTQELEDSPAQENPDAARFISTLGSRLMNVGQRLGRPLMPPGVGDRPFEGPAEG